MRRLAYIATLLLLPCGMLGQSFSGGARIEPEIPIEILTAPIHLQDGETLQNRRFQMDLDTFAWNSWAAAIFIDGSNVTVRNVEIVGASSWLPRWDEYVESGSPPPPGIVSSMVGIRAQNTGAGSFIDHLLIENVSVRGFPHSCFDIAGNISDSVIRDFTARDCFQGITHRYTGYPSVGQNRSSRVLIERIRIEDTWGPGPGLWPGIGSSDPDVLSVDRPGGYIGSDGLALGAMDNTIIRDVEVLGEQLASIKVVNMRDTVIEDFRGVGLMVQGTTALAQAVGEPTSTGLTLRNFELDKSLGVGHWVEAVNTMQIVWHLRNFRIEHCHLDANGELGNGVLFSVDIQGTVRDCTIEDHNGVPASGPQPKHAALAIVDGTDGEAYPDSTWNADFEDANTFIDQDELLYWQ